MKQRRARRRESRVVDYRQIYRTQAAAYERLVAHEDYQGHLLLALQAVRPLVGLEVIELGAGTGRLTRLLAAHVGRITVLDRSAHMLAHAADCNAGRAVADNRALPIAAGSADLALAGWTLGHFTGWYPDIWQLNIGRAVAEMVRVLKPGGTAVILETLGTGRETPRPPSADLTAYYRWLEESRGFNHTWIRTDYRFPTPQEAAAVSRFFFGDDLAGMILAEGITDLPECTGIWWLTF